MRPYPAELEGEIVLRDGTRVKVRPIRPDDAERETRFVAGLSERTRFQRFMYQLKDLPPGMLQRFLHLDYDRELALVALHADEFIAVARYAPNPGTTSAEFALVVTDAWQRKGLGRAMLEKLCEEARKAGYTALYGTILDANTEMLELVRRLGFVHDSRDGATVTLVKTLT
jgi:acetyltransferase